MNSLKVTDTLLYQDYQDMIKQLKEYKLPR